MVFESGYTFTFTHNRRTLMPSFTDRKRGLLFSALSVVSIGTYFISLTHDATLSYFDPDSSTNLYRSWCSPLSSLVKANLLFFLSSQFYRPMGCVWHRVIFYFAGFNPLPFNIADLVFLAANIWLTYAVCRRLSDCREAGVLAALMIAYHRSFRYVYFDIAFVFDVLCYFFYFSALLIYIRARSQHRALATWESIAFLALYICALNSKEMAITLPAVLVVYEWLYQDTRDWMRWSLTQGRALLIAGCFTLLFVIGRSMGSESLTRIGDYRPVFTYEQVMISSRNFISGVFFKENDPPLTALLVILIWVLLFAVAMALKSRALKFAWFFIMLSPLPIVFIHPPRGPAQYYVSYFGFVLYASTALVLCFRRFDVPPALRRRPPGAAVAAGA